jgi:hypothetical protein
MAAFGRRPCLEWVVTVELDRIWREANDINGDVGNQDSVRVHYANF